MAWSLHDAKNRLSQLVRQAQDAPQMIAVQGEERAVVLSLDAYRRLTHRDEHGLQDFLQASPWADVELELERVTDPPRDIDLIEENETQGRDSDAIDPATEP